MYLVNASDCTESYECLVKLPPFSKGPFPADGDCGNIFEQGCNEASGLQILNIGSQLQANISYRKHNCVGESLTLIGDESRKSQSRWNYCESHTT